MRKLIIIVLFLTVILVYFNFIYGWLDFYRMTNTPEKYLNTVVPSKESYIKDSVILVSLFKEKLINREGFFNKSSYFDSTEIIIDTILYSPDFNKISVLVVVKNPTYKQIAPDLKHKHYYDATCYLGIRNYSGFDLSWVGPNFTNSISYQMISENLRIACLKRFATTDGSYKYNMNDKRFWKSSIWSNNFTNKKSDM